MITHRYLVLAVFGIIFLFPFGCKKDDVNKPKTGPEWVVFNRSNSPIYSNNVLTVFSGNENTIWFGTDSGASSFHAGFWGGIRESLSYTLSHGVGRQVNAITQSKDGSLWFGLQGGGIVRYTKGGSSQAYTHFSLATDLIPSDFVAGLAGELTQLGEVYAVSVSGGGSRYTPDLLVAGEGVWHQLKTDNRIYLPYPNIPTVAINPVDYNIWFGTYSDGTTEYNGDQTFTNFALPNTYNFAIKSMAFDLAGLVWIGKSDSGVSVLNKATGVWLRHYTNSSTGGKLPQGPVNAVVTNFRTVRWFGTNHGLVQLADSTWTLYTTSNSPLPSNIINALSIDTNGNLWIGTNKGVVAFQAGGTIFGN